MKAWSSATEKVLLVGAASRSPGVMSRHPPPVASMTIGDRQCPRRGRTVGRGNPQSRRAAIGLWVDRRHLPDDLRPVGRDLRIGNPQESEEVFDLHRAPSHRLGGPRDRAGGSEERADEESHEAGQTATHGRLRKLEDGPATTSQARIQARAGAPPQDNAPRPRPGIVRSSRPIHQPWGKLGFIASIRLINGLGAVGGMLYASALHRKEHSGVSRQG